MSEDKILAVCEVWITELANDMKAEIDSLVTHAGGQTSELSASVSPNVKVLANGNVEVSLSMNNYWYWVEHGRNPNSKAPPSKPIDAWIRQKNISVDITIKKKETKQRKGLTKVARGLSYDNKVKRLAYVIAKSIGKKGTKARPFFNKIFNEARVEQLKKRLAPVMKEAFIIELKNGNYN